MKFKRTICTLFGALVATSSSHAQERIRIGVLEDMSGLYADITGRGSVVAAQMAIEDIGGTLLGQPIEIVSADHQNKPDIASATAREWLDEAGVTAILGLGNSAAALAVQEIGRERGKFVMVSSAGATALTGEACSPTGVHWTYDTRALAYGTGGASVREGLDSWYFITADYAFGHSLEESVSKVVDEAGGSVLGAIRHPLGSPDFSSYLLQAQASGAKIIGLASAGSDTTNAMRQAAEFGIVEAGQSLAGLLLFITDIHAASLEIAQGMVLTTGFYWDRNEETRTWSRRFYDEIGRMPTMAQVGVYSSAMHLFRAIEAVGSTEPEAVMQKMRDTPVRDILADNGTLRADGRMVYDMYLVRVKSPEESKEPWDYYEIVATIPGDEIFLPLSESACPLVR